MYPSSTDLAQCPTRAPDALAGSRLARLAGLLAAPFTLGVVRYALLIEEGRGGAPTEVFLRDRVLQLAGLTWIGIYLTGVYAIGV